MFPESACLLGSLCISLKRPVAGHFSSSPTSPLFYSVSSLIHLDPHAVPYRQQHPVAICYSGGEEENRSRRGR
jgi:hypothetical protein